MWPKRLNLGNVTAAQNSTLRTWSLGEGVALCPRHPVTERVHSGGTLRRQRGRAEDSGHGACGSPGSRCAPSAVTETGRWCPHLREGASGRAMGQLPTLQEVVTAFVQVPDGPEQLKRELYLERLTGSP